MGPENIRCASATRVTGWRAGQDGKPRSHVLGPNWCRDRDSCFNAAAIKWLHAADCLCRLRMRSTRPHSTGLSEERECVYV